MQVQLGLFKLIVPPEGQVEIISKTLSNIDYPWQRIIPAIRKDPDQAVLVKWDSDMQQGATGLFYGRTYEIVLGTRYANWQSKVPFVFAHELGHMVDRATFDDETRDAILAKYHTDLDGKWDDREDPNNPGEPFVWSHENPHREAWRNGHDVYYLRPNEAYADSFVAAFAPSIWNSSSPRFAHWTKDFAAIRRLTLARRIQVFEDVPEDHIFNEEIEWAAGQGIITGWPDGTFRPDEPVTRQAFAAMLKRYHDTVNATSA